MSEENKKEPDSKKTRRFSQAQYDMLKRCSDKWNITEWNNWQKENPAEDILLEGADLAVFHLKRAYLCDAYLKGADLTFAHLEGAAFMYANLKSANFFSAFLNSAYLMHAHLEDSNFCCTHLEGANFKAVRINSNTHFSSCCIDRKTDFREVSLDTVRIFQGTKQLLEYNGRRMNWQDWYKEHPFLRWPVWWFWSVSDYGRSTGRIIGWFFGLALAFAVVYSNLAWLYPPGIVDGLFAEPNTSDQISLVAYFLVVLLRPIYFSVVTMTTLGFGDMHARAWSWPGHVLLMLQVLLGYVLLAALVTRFAVLFTAGGPAGKFADEKTLRQRIFGDLTFTEWFFGEQPKNPTKEPTQKPSETPPN